MAFTKERKLEIAERSYRLLVDKLGVPPENIMFDALVFPAATSKDKSVKTALETVEAIAALKKKYPEINKPIELGKLDD